MQRERRHKGLYLIFLCIFRQVSMEQETTTLASNRCKNMRCLTGMPALESQWPKYLEWSLHTARTVCISTQEKQFQMGSSPVRRVLLKTDLRQTVEQVNMLQVLTTACEPMAYEAKSTRFCMCTTHKSVTLVKAPSRPQLSGKVPVKPSLVRALHNNE